MRFSMLSALMYTLVVVFQYSIRDAARHENAYVPGSGIDAPFNTPLEMPHKRHLVAALFLHHNHVLSILH